MTRTFQADVQNTNTTDPECLVFPATRVAHSCRVVELRAVADLHAEIITYADERRATGHLAKAVMRASMQVSGLCVVITCEQQRSGKFDP